MMEHQHKPLPFKGGARGGCDASASLVLANKVGVADRLHPNPSPEEEGLV